MEPAARLLDHLADARREGRTFTVAWPEAVELALAEVADEPEPDRRGWRAALTATREAWAQAWDRQPPARRAELALAAVADDPDREALPDFDGRSCARCGGPIPPGRGRRGAPALYCGPKCKRAANYERERSAA